MYLADMPQKRQYPKCGHTIMKLPTESFASTYPRRTRMKALVMATTVLIGLLAMSCFPSDAHEPGHVLTPAEMRVYQACLVAAWTKDYCRSRYWSDRLYATCAANVHRRFPRLGSWIGYNEEYCWHEALGFRE
jgi:hypothetical protein